MLTSSTEGSIDNYQKHQFIIFVSSSFTIAHDYHTMLFLDTLCIRYCVININLAHAIEQNEILLLVLLLIKQCIVCSGKHTAGNPCLMWHNALDTIYSHCVIADVSNIFWLFLNWVVCSQPLEPSIVIDDHKPKYLSWVGLTVQQKIKYLSWAGGKCQNLFWMRNIVSRHMLSSFVVQRTTLPMQIPRTTSKIVHKKKWAEK